MLNFNLYDQLTTIVANISNSIREHGRAKTPHNYEIEQYNTLRAPYVSINIIRMNSNNKSASKVANTVYHTGYKDWLSRDADNTWYLKVLLYLK